MAAETELIFLVTIGYIHIIRKFFRQHLFVLRAMGVMAGGALSGADRAVEDLHVFLYDVLMALQTKIFPLFGQEFIIVA